jgi:hypothetical protein
VPKHIRQGARDESGTKVGEDGENPAVIIGCRREIELAKDRFDVRLDGLDVLMRRCRPTPSLAEDEEKARQLLPQASDISEDEQA